MSSGIVSLRCMPISGQNKPQHTSNIMKPDVAMFKLPTTEGGVGTIREGEEGAGTSGEEKRSCSDGKHVAEGGADAGAGEDGGDQGTSDEAGGHEASEDLRSVTIWH
jgi:hypothetical protein